jgi:hypothetical protein
MPGSQTALGRAGARNSAPVRIAFRKRNSVGTQDDVDFAAQWLAYAIPCRRFACILADTCARLGADVVCYSFIVVDFHHLLLADLSAHSANDPLYACVSAGRNRKTQRRSLTKARLSMGLPELARKPVALRASSSEASS